MVKRNSTSTPPPWPLIETVWSCYGKPTENSDNCCHCVTREAHRKQRQLLSQPTENSDNCFHWTTTSSVMGPCRALTCASSRCRASTPGFGPIVEDHSTLLPPTSGFCHCTRYKPQTDFLKKNPSLHSFIKMCIKSLKNNNRFQKRDIGQRGCQISGNPAWDGLYFYRYS